MSRGYKAGVRGGGGIIPPGPVVPDGKTVTPINDIPIWLKCAGIPTTSYTTLSEVLADTSLLRVLINSENAMDYLVRCKEWIKQEALVPVMTSNTTPSGIASASSEASTTRQAWKGFAGESANGWMPSESSYPAWIQYKFDAPTLATNLKALYKNDSGTSYTQKVEISASNDGTNWTTFATNVLLNSNNAYTDISFTNDNEYLYYRMTLLSGSEAPQPFVGSGYLLQFYSISEGVTDNQSAMSYIGANNYASNTLLADSTWLNAICNSTYFESVLNVKVPTMTSNTTPSGVVSADSFRSGNEPYKAFSNTVNDTWVSNHPINQGQSATGWIKYDFGYSFNFVFAELANQNAHTGQYTSATLEVSEDDITYTTAGTCTGGTLTNIITSPMQARYVKLSLTMINTNTWSDLYPRLYGESSRAIQFYGRKDGGVQSWLLSAGITNKTYTSLSEVFNDTETLRALLNNHDAVYYLTTVPGWATEFAANENAMKYIGANDYASNLLLSDKDWCKAISNSTYFESVLNVKVPTMTSATTPSGEAGANVSRSGYDPYYAFNGNTSDGKWWTGDSSSNNYIYYKFDNVCNIRRVDFWYGTFKSPARTMSIKYQVSNNGTDWIDKKNFDVTISGTTSPIPVQYTSFVVDDNGDNYLYNRLLFTSGTRIGDNDMILVSELQFYGREKGGVQSWLLAAGITNKNYTTVSQVLADSDLLPVLIASHSGMDYLATCVAFANEICVNETAMQLIGADNYAADALLSNETWLNAIANSTYYAEVLNTEVPTMTSNTTPSGECFANHEFDTSSKAYMAFDNNPNTMWSGSGTGAFPSIIGYKFSSAKKIKIFKIMPNYNNSKTDIGNFIIEGSNDGTTYTQILSDIIPNGVNSNIWFTFIANNMTAYEYYRIYITSNYRGATSALGAAKEIQFYGRQDV